jgi:hypothetical protein
MYDEEGALSKVMTGDRIRIVGKHTLPTHWEMQPADAPGQKTILEYTLLRFDIPLSESFFSEQNMRRVR